MKAITKAQLPEIDRDRVQFTILAAVIGEEAPLENLMLLSARYTLITTSQNGELELIYAKDKFGDDDATMLDHMREQLGGGCPDTRILRVDGHAPFTHLAYFPDAGTYLLQMEERADGGDCSASTKTLRDFGLWVKEGVTTPSRAGKQPKPVWTVGGAVAGYEDLFYRLGGRKWRGDFSFWVDPSGPILAALLSGEERESFADRLAAKRERAEARAERYEGRAEKAEAHGGALYNQAQEMASNIPFGQPILIGHHSEKRDRNYREKIRGKFVKSFEEADKAKEYKRKAHAAEWKAEAPKDLGFMGRRLKEAKAELGKCRRNLEEVRTSTHPFYTDEVRAQEVTRFTRLIADYTERVAHWEGEIAKEGGVQFSKETIKKGDVIRWAMWVGVVVRVNATTVTVDVNAGNGWQPKVPYSAILERVPAGEAQGE